jgi:hypothetical protein
MASHYKKIVFIALPAFFFFIACNLPGLSKAMSVDEMKIIMWDMMKADELNNLQATKDSGFAVKKMNFTYYEQVFKIHDITREEFYNSLKYYEAHPPLMKTLIDSLDQYAARERNKLYQPDIRYGNGFGGTATRTQ